MNKAIRNLTIEAFIIALATAAHIYAASGTSAANFLKIGTGARGAAMGEAQVALTEDVNSLYWNPAGLTHLRYNELSLMHYSLVDGVTFNQANFGIPTLSKGTFAVGVSLLDYGSIQGYASDSTPTGSVSANNTLITGSWAKKISDKSNVTAGVSLKYLSSKLAGYSASAPMIDLGVAYPLQNPKYRGLRLAAALRNVGPALKYDREGSPLPQQLVMGGALAALGGNLNIGLDFIKPKDNNAYIATGIEYRLFDMLMVRAGYNGLSNFVGNGITYGMGLKFRQWNLDYAFVPYGDLGNTNRVSVSVRFGHALEMQKADDAVEFSYKRAEQQLALGHPVEAYSSLTQLLEIAPWHKPSVELKAKIEKQFEEMSVSKNRAKFEAEISEKFTEAKAQFDREELVDAKKGFELILKLQPDHVGSKVYLERIQGRYTALADDSFKQGMAFYAVSDYAQAKVLFEKTLTIDPNYKDAQAQLEKTISMIEDSSRRQKEMELLAGAADAYKAGLNSYQKNDLEDALVKFTEVQGKVPQYEEVGRYLQLTKKSLSEVLFNQAQVNSENGQLSDATKKLERAATLAPEDQRIKTALAVAQRDLSSKNSEEAKKLYKDGLEAYLNGQTEKASGLWKKALELDPSNDEAMKALTKVEEQKKYGTTNPEK